MSEQKSDTPEDSSEVSPKVDETTNEPPLNQSPPARRTLALLAIGVIAVALFWWNSQDNASDAQTEPEPTAVAVVDDTPTAGPSPTPDPTPTGVLSPLANEQASASEQQTITETAQLDVLPTVTPTPEVRTVTSRTVQISGNATLRVSLENPDFESGGAPLDFPLESRTYLLTSDQSGLIEQHCLQLGLVHVLFNWDLELVPANNNVLARANLQLYDDFCDAPGELRDTVPIEVQVPADASAELTLNLQGRRNLLNVPDLLDTSTSVFLVLTIANRPAQ